LVSLAGPSSSAKPLAPAKGEVLELGNISDLTDVDPRIAAALRRLAVDKAPVAVAQLTMWNLVAGIDWTTLARFSRTWANPNELALARDFANHAAKGEIPVEGTDSGAIYLEVSGTGADELRGAIKDHAVLGLAVRSEIPRRPEGPAVCCRVSLAGSTASVQVGMSDPAGREWVSIGKFTTPVAETDGKLNAPELMDQIAEGLVNRLVRVQLLKDKSKDASGHPTHHIRIENASPLVMNGIMLVGPSGKASEHPTGLAGLSIPPRKRLTVPVTADAIDRLGLANGIQVLAADLSGL
jgi:hypothetical protein